MKGLTWDACCSSLIGILLVDRDTLKVWGNGCSCPKEDGRHFRPLSIQRDRTSTPRASCLGAGSRRARRVFLLVMDDVMVFFRLDREKVRRGSDEEHATQQA
jgi:hypothetical protein